MNTPNHPRADLLSDVDQMLLWLEPRVHHIDNIRKLPNGLWSIQFWMSYQASEPPQRFAAVTVQDAVEAAVGHVLAVRADQRERCA